MNVLIDMNLSPEWEFVFEKVGIKALHWTKVGQPEAPDSTLMDWARENNSVILTHDLDFGTTLALTGASKPSVVQVRTQDVRVAHFERFCTECFLILSRTFKRRGSAYHRRT
jgi:predicted nuclease of predicted toxin-antitoxin system